MRMRGRRRTKASGRHWRIAALAAAGAIGATSQAEAQLYYWSDSDPGFSRNWPTVSHQRHKPRRYSGKKIEAPQKESGKPQGPLIIAISIEKQSLKIYDAGGFFAQTPISTGMRGHPTPMGVFSVIQKQKLHHSNIYSGAPMPYMQRITWSGVAMHAGVLPGYPASHGCIRMPMAFAVKMWGWTKMGARVVVTPGEMTPASFTHPLLAAQKVAPIQEANLELRSTLGHADGARLVMAESPASTPLREQTHTADASAALPAANASITMTDATSSGGKPTPRDQAGAAPQLTANAVSAGDAPNLDSAKSETFKPAAEPAIASSSETTPASSEIVRTEMSATDGMKIQPHADEAKVEAKADHVNTEAPKADAPKLSEKLGEKPDENVKTITDVGSAAPDAQGDKARLDAGKAVVSKPATAAPKRTGQISVFVSRKDSKLYVRQNFAPLFETPVTIAPSDRPLGTHVFTAQVDKNDANVLHWSVVSLPVRARYAEQRDVDDRASHRRKMAGAAEIKPVPASEGPAEALDRLSIPADAMARITEALSTGGSIIVSDQGIAGGETGEGTDFIVSLR